MDKDQDIDNKILKVLTGQATAEERRAVNVWIKKSKSNEFQFEQLKQYWNRDTVDPRLIGHEEQKKKIWKALAAKNPHPRPAPVIPIYRKTWFRVAVMVLILLVPVYIIYVDKGPEEELSVQEVKWVSKSNSDGRKSLIHLPDGSKAWLNSASKITYPENFTATLRAITLEGEAYFE